MKTTLLTLLLGISIPISGLANENNCSNFSIHQGLDLQNMAYFLQKHQAPGVCNEEGQCHLNIYSDEGKEKELVGSFDFPKNPYDLVTADQANGEHLFKLGFTNQEPIQILGYGIANTHKLCLPNNYANFVNTYAKLSDIKDRQSGIEFDYEAVNSQGVPPNLQN